jgi:nicotinamidase/pyrazinamidase
MKRVLLVLDMLEGFVRKEYPLYCGTDGERIIPVIQKIIEEFNSRGETVIFIADHHKPEDEEFKMFPSHCVEGTKEAEVIPELWDVAENKILVPKTRFAAFYDTNLDEELKKIAPDETHVTGVCTNICVLFTVEELLNRRYPTVVYRDGVASFDSGAHEHALKQMKDVLGVQIK